MTPPDAVFGPHLKGFPTSGVPLTRAQIPAQGWRLLRGDLALPLAVLKRSALQHNLHWMRDFCAQLRQDCIQLEVQYEQVRTDTPLEVALTTYLERRSAV